MAEFVDVKQQLVELQVFSCLSFLLGNGSAEAGHEKRQVLGSCLFVY